MALKDLSHAAERQALSLLLDGFLKKVNNAQDEEARKETWLKLFDAVEKRYSNVIDPKRVEKAKQDVRDNGRWIKYLNRIVDETNPNVLKTMILNLGYEAFFKGTSTVREMRKKYNCEIPWLILFDPTMACNEHCVGCWSGTYGHKHSMTYELMDKIVTEGSALGVHVYIMTGGEPMVRKKDILRLAKEHHDCAFAMFTNSTLIDEEFCQEVQRLGNIEFFVSIEGYADTNDARRGQGHFEAVMKAMDLMKKYGLIFGTSICYTRANIDVVTSEKFLRMVADKGARFGFFFHYMPVGKNAAVDLIPTVEQRQEIIRRIRYYRSDESDLPFFPMDFQNDGEYVGGCIAGGRNYFHINANGDAEPCVFIHFSDRNLNDCSLLEALQSPLFTAYREGQPFNRNHLRPCPMLENPDLLRRMVKESGAHQTNDEAPEEVDELCAKADAYSKEWAPVAEEIWKSQPHKKLWYENFTEEKREHPELAAFQHPDGTDEIKCLKDMKKDEKTAASNR